MGDVVTFRLRATVAQTSLAPSLAETRRVIEEAAQAALDTADNLLAILDRMDGDADAEDGGDTEPSLAAPENDLGSQVVWMRGNDADREAGAPEAVLPVVIVSPVPRVRPADLAPELMAWGGNGNVVAAAGIVLFDAMTICSNLRLSKRG